MKYLMYLVFVLIVMLIVNFIAGNFAGLIGEGVHGEVAFMSSIGLLIGTMIVCTREIITAVSKIDKRSN